MSIEHLFFLQWLLCGIVLAAPMDAAKQFLAAAQARKLRISPADTHPAAAPVPKPKTKPVSSKGTGAMAWCWLMGLGNTDIY